jgi:hypothetical protein
MTASNQIHTHCPDCDRPSDWPRDSTHRVCPCGWERFKIRVALPINFNQLGELLWAKALGEDRYELDTVPLCAFGLNAGDVVRAVIPPSRPEALPEVVELIRPGGRSTFWVRFTEAGLDSVSSFFASLPEDIGRETQGPLHGFDVRTDQSEDVIRRLKEAETDGILGWGDNRATRSGRFDNLGDDLLGEYYGSVVFSRRAPETTNTEDLKPISDEELESELWERLGWKAGTPRPKRFRLRLSTSHEVRSRSKGAVRLPRTINPRTYAPKHQGLFAPEIWGHAAGRGGAGLRETYGDFKAAIRAPEGYFGPGGHVELPLAVRHPWFPGRSHPALHLDAVPVLPPGLRPVFVVDDGRVAVADVNYLYMRLIDLTHRADVQAIDLQGAIDALFMNEALEQPTTKEGNPVVSLHPQLGREPVAVLVKLDKLLASGGVSLAGPLPKGEFYILRALEALCIMTEEI